MSLPFLFEQPEDQDTWRRWAFNHAAIHLDVVNALTNQNKATGLGVFLLNPMNLDDLGMWLYRHQTMHNQANTALGSSGYNLLSLDWRDDDQLQEWLFLNADEHQRFAQKLGVE